MIKVFSWGNAYQRPRNYEKYVSPSRTVPGQSEDLETVVRRHLSGALTGVQSFPGTYDPEDLLPPGVEKWDFAQRRELAEKYGKKATAIREQLIRRAQKPDPAPVDPVDGA